jgi:hypothetical protein
MNEKSIFGIISIFSKLSSLLATDLKSDVSRSFALEEIEEALEY